MRQVLGLRALRRITGETYFTPERFNRLNQIAEVAIGVRPDLASRGSWNWDRPTSTLTVLTRHGMMERSF